jgi:tetratricopeptide (TPR) repeat protein
MSLAYLSIISALDLIGQIAEGSALMDRFLEFLAPWIDQNLHARYWRNIIVGVRGAHAYEDPWRALHHCDQVQAVVDATGIERFFISMQLFRGMNLWYLGARGPAERLLEEAAAVDQVMGQVGSLRRFALAWLRADRGELDEARALATELREYGRARNLPPDEWRGRWVLAEVLRRQGDLDEAERELAAALAMAAPLDRPGILGTLAAVRLAQGRVIEAREAAEEAVARCTAMGGGCGMFRGPAIRLARAELLHATGELDAARAAIAEARARLLAVADKIIDPDRRAGFLEGVPENARTLALARVWIDESGPHE